ncbi:hypothetical protein FRC07_006695, partial [Ceratobasidium sp. 392]
SAAAHDLVPALGPTAFTSAHTPGHGAVLAHDSIQRPAANPAPALASTPITSQQAVAGRTNKDANKELSSAGKTIAHANAAATTAQIESKLAHSEGNRNHDTSEDWNEAEGTVFRTGSSVKELAKLAHTMTNVEVTGNAHVGVKDTKGKTNILGTVAHVFNTSKEKVEEQVWRGFGSAFGSVLGSISTHTPAAVGQTQASPTLRSNITSLSPASSPHTPTPIRASGLAPNPNLLPDPTPAPSHAAIPSLSFSPSTARTTNQPSLDDPSPPHVQVPAHPWSPSSTVEPAPASISMHNPGRVLTLDTRSEPEHPIERASSSTTAAVLAPSQQMQAHFSTSEHHEKDAYFSGTRKVESHVEKVAHVVQTGEILVVNRTLDQQAKRGISEATAVEVVRTESTRGITNMTPATTRAEERFDLDTISDNPVGQANASNSFAFTLGAALGRTSERRVWRSTGLITSHRHDSPLASEQVQDTDSIPKAVFIPASAAATVPSSESASSSSRVFGQPLDTASVSNLAPTPVQPNVADTPPSTSIPELERAKVQTLTTSPVRTMSRAPTRDFSSDPFLAPTQVPTSAADPIPAHTSMRNATPASDRAPKPIPTPALESTPSLANYSTTPLTSVHSPSPTHVFAGVRDLATEPRTPESTPSSAHGFIQGRASSLERVGRPTSLPTSSPARTRKYLYASRRSVPSTPGLASVSRVYQDSMLAITEDAPDSASSLAVPPSRRAPAPAPIRVFTPEARHGLAAAATSTPVRDRSSSSAYVSAHTPASSTEEYGVEDSPVQSGPDAMSALDSAIWAIDSAIFALDMVANLESTPATPQEPAPSPVLVTAISTPAPDPALPQTPVRVPPPALAHSPDVAPVLDWSSASELALALSTELPVASPRLSVPSPAPS